MAPPRRWHRSLPVWREPVESVRPMLATLADVSLQDAHLAYELKYDGIRALVTLDARALPRVEMRTRTGRETSAAFPDLVREFERLLPSLQAPLLLDGEVVALDEAGQPASFTRLQGRLGVRSSRAARAQAEATPAAFVAFDLLRDGEADLRSLPLSDRRMRLERVWADTGSPRLRLSEQVAGDGQALMRRAVDEGWEGLVAKHLDSRYVCGTRSADWKKLKLVHRQEFVIAGWTPQRGAARRLGALVLAVMRDGALTLAGAVGTGFDQAEQERLLTALRPLTTPTPSLADASAVPDDVTWVRPELVAEVKFAEWTPAGHLRHPVYLGLRRDVDVASVRREAPATAGPATGVRRAVAPRTTSESPAPRPDGRPLGPPAGSRARDRRTAGLRESPAGARDCEDREQLSEQLTAIEHGGGQGRLTLPDGSALEVTNLGKVFWPASRLTKGDLLRYYVGVAPWLLPVVQDRPLVMKRLPNGIAGASFYQQRAPDAVPAGVRVERVEGDTDVPARVIGGSLRTLLYLAQLAVISQDPWFSRVESPDSPDFLAFDLDPMPGVSFAQVADVARWVREELDLLRISCALKTSGSSGLHLFVALPDGLPFEAGQIFAQIVATIVAQKHPRVATVERGVAARGRTVYVDYLQNIRGKSLACAYSARGSEFAGVSTPLRWEELDAGAEPRDFTIVSAPARFDAEGDLWAEALAGPPADLSAVFRYVEGGRR